MKVFCMAPPSGASYAIAHWCGVLAFFPVICHGCMLYAFARGAKTELGEQVTKQGLDFLSFYTNRQ